VAVSGPCGDLIAIINFINNQVILTICCARFYLAVMRSWFSVKGESDALSAGSGGCKNHTDAACLQKTERDFLTK